MQSQTGAFTYKLSQGWSESGSLTTTLSLSLISLIIHQKGTSDIIKCCINYTPLIDLFSSFLLNNQLYQTNLWSHQIIMCWLLSILQAKSFLFLLLVLSSNWESIMMRSIILWWAIIRTIVAIPWVEWDSLALSLLSSLLSHSGGKHQLFRFCSSQQTKTSSEKYFIDNQFVTLTLKTVNEEDGSQPRKKRRDTDGPK